METGMAEKQTVASPSDRGSWRRRGERSNAKDGEQPLATVVLRVAVPGLARFITISQTSNPWPSLF
jgi:hypothetical protein